MNREEILREAQRRLQKSPNTVKAFRERMNWYRDQPKDLREVRPEDRPKVVRIQNELFSGAYAGGVTRRVYEETLLSDFGITRDDVKNHVANPYIPSLRRAVIVELVLIALSVLCIVLGFKGRNIRGVIAYSIVFAAFMGLLWLLVPIIDILKFRHHQKMYCSGAWEEEEIRAEMFRLMKEDWQKNGQSPCREETQISETQLPSQ